MSVFVLQEYGDDGYSDELIAAYTTLEAAEDAKAAYLSNHPTSRLGRPLPTEVGVVEVSLQPADQDALRVLLDWLWLSESSGWTCPACGAGNGGAYRLDCKYCNEGRHPMAEVLIALWRGVGRTIDGDQFASHELAPPDTWTKRSEGFPRSEPPRTWPEYADKIASR